MPREGLKGGLLPAERAEKVGDGGAVGTQGFDARAAGGEEAALGVEDVELAGDAVVVAQAREAQGLAQRLGARRFGFVALERARLRGERAADFAERGLDGLLVLRQDLALARRGGIGAGLEPAAGEDRLGQREADVPEAGRTGEEVGERGALAAKRAGERDGGKHLRARLRDARVRRGKE